MEIWKKPYRSRNWCNTTSTCRRFGGSIQPQTYHQFQSDRIYSKISQSCSARRSKNDAPINLAEVPIIEDSVHWSPKRDVRNTELTEKLEYMNDLYKSASDHDKIVSVMCGWHDEHIHTEFLSSEGMNRVWSFQRTLINAMETAREASEVVSYRTRHGGEGGLELIEDCDLESLGSNARIQP